MQVVHATYREGFGEAVQVPSILQNTNLEKVLVGAARSRHARQRRVVHLCAPSPPRDIHVTWLQQ